MQAAAATAWPKVLIIYGGGVLAATQLGTVPPIAQALQRDLAASLPLIALTTSVPTLVGAVAGAMVGVWAERFGHARSLGAGLAIMVIAAAASAMAGDGEMLLALRACLGIGYLMVVTSAPSLMAQLTQPAHQPLALSLWGTFVPIGLAVAACLAALVVADTGWRGFLWIDAALLAVGCFVVAIAIRGPAEARPSPGPPAALKDLRAPLLLAISFFCFAWVFLAVATLLPSHLVLNHGLSDVAAGWIVAVATTGGAAGSLMAGPLLRFGRSPRSLATLGLLLPAAAAGLVFAPAVPMALVAAGIAVIFIAGGLVPSVAFASVPVLVRAPSGIGPANGLLAQFGSIGSLAGPPLLTLWVEWTGWTWAMLPVGLVSATGVACGWTVLAGRRMSRAPA
jgi:MFS family permease